MLVKSSSSPKKKKKVAQAPIVLAVVGSRGIVPFELQGGVGPGQVVIYDRVVLHKVLDVINTAFLKIKTKFPDRDVEVITGDAIGIDHISTLWAKNKQCDYRVITAKWLKHGKSAGMVRNPRIIEPADYVLVIWDGESNGTRNSYEHAKRLDKKVRLVDWRKQ